MRWLVDECVDAALVAHLREAGHDALYMAEMAPATSDADVMARAQRDGRLLLTEDKDFAIWCFVAVGRFLGSFCCASIRPCTRLSATVSTLRFLGLATDCTAAI